MNSKSYLTLSVIVVVQAMMKGAETSCVFEASSRRDCGVPGITRVTCEGNGCCFDNSQNGVPWCFHPADGEGSVGAASRLEGTNIPPQALFPYRPTNAAIQYSGSCLFHCTSIARTQRFACGSASTGEQACLTAGCCYDAADYAPERRCYFPAGLERPCPSERCLMPGGRMNLCNNGLVSGCEPLGCCVARMSGHQICYHSEDPPVYLGSAPQATTTSPSYRPTTNRNRVSTTTLSPTTTTQPPTTTTTTRRPSFIEILRQRNGGSLGKISIYDILTKSMSQLLRSRNNTEDRENELKPASTSTTTTTRATTTTTTIATTTRITTPTTAPPLRPLRRVCSWGRCRLVPGPTQAQPQCFPSECGQPRIYPGSTLKPPTNSRRKVVGGTRVYPFSQPWTAMIVKKEGNRTFICGAAVISEHWLLTVAHCLNRQSVSTDVPDLDAIFYKIYVGRYVGWRQKHGKQVQIFDGRRDIDYMEQHESFVAGKSRGVISYDIAVIRVRRAIQFNQYVQPVCLSDVRPDVGKVIWATGWGVTKNRGPNDSAMKQVAQMVLNETSCIDEVPRFTQEHADSLLCVGGERYHDTCTGDSGGPVVAPKTMGYDRRRRPIQRWQLYGLTSLGSPSCNTLNFDRQPALYTNIAHYMPWIRARTHNGCR